MSPQTTLSLAALAALVPMTLRLHRSVAVAPDRLFWWLLAVAVTGPLVHALVLLQGPWSSGLAYALWISIAASLLCYVPLAIWMPAAWRLSLLLLPYLLILGILALLTGASPAMGTLTVTPEEPWLLVHIVVAVGTYALATLAAVAALSVFLQERALKRKRPTRLTRFLPSIADGERLQFRLLMVAEIVLGLGLATGMALRYAASGGLWHLDHKTLLSLLAFVTIGILLILQRRTGLRGRQAGRLVLLAYMLLTLAYPGVKFVTDVLLA